MSKWIPLIEPWVIGNPKLPEIGDRVIVTQIYSDYQTIARFTGSTFVEISTLKPVGATHWRPCPKSPAKTCSFNCTYDLKERG